MLKILIEECFSNVKNDSPSSAKKTFGYIWAVLASKRIRFNDGDIWIAWRELSAELVNIYNEWFNCSFTTDAFLQAYSPDKPMGEDSKYDNVLMKICAHGNCIGVFKVKTGPAIRSSSNVGIFKEVNVVTGEEHCYKQGYNKGHRVGDTERISVDEYESLCFSCG